jgi:hypothetical protein
MGLGVLKICCVPACFAQFAAGPARAPRVGSYIRIEDFCLVGVVVVPLERALDVPVADADCLAVDDVTRFEQSAGQD